MPAKQMPLKRIKGFAVSALILFLVFLLVFIPGPALSGARNGLALCGNTIIPSLFPFLVFSSFIIGSGAADRCGRLLEPLTRHIFGLPGSSGTAIVLGAVGGYPVGADSVSKLCENGLITKKDGERLLCFAINSSPAFIIGAVGAGFFGSAQTGILLYCAHLLASFSIGIIMKAGAEKIPRTYLSRPRAERQHADNTGVSAAFVKAVTDSAKSIIVICAFVILFSSLNSLFTYIGTVQYIASAVSKIIPPPPADPLFYNRAAAGILEVTNGCAAASGSSGIAAVLLTAAMLGFSGISVQFQVTSLVAKSGLSVKPFILTRFLHVLFSVLFAFALFSVFPGAVPAKASVMAFAFNPSDLHTAFHGAPAVCAMLLLIAMLLLSLVKA